MLLTLIYYPNYFLAIVKMKGALEKSTEVMQTMNNLIKVPELAATMKNLSKEMMKVGKNKMTV